MSATVAAQLQVARESLAPVAGELAALEARLLAQHAWGVTPELIVRDPHRKLEQEKISEFEALIARRLTREPIAQILGHKYFWKDRFMISRDVLTPRADSETLIETALRLRPTAEQLLDLGTGSGCLLLSLLGEYPHAMGVGVDTSPAALLIAIANAKALGRDARCEFIGGNWCETLEINARFDMVVANPPYIPTGKIARLMSEVRDHEPKIALDGGADGLDCYRAILAQVGPHMKPAALLLFEVGEGQANDVAMLGQAHGYRWVETVKDLNRIDRVVVFEKPSSEEEADAQA